MEHRNAPEHFIPLARSELIDLLCADRALPAEERDAFRSFCELVSAAYHVDYHRRLLELKRSYQPFDPDSDTASLLPPRAEERQERLNDLYSDLAWVLERARFKHLSRDEIEPALEGASDWGIRMDVDFSAFEHIALFVRGDTVQTRSRQRLWNLYRVEEAEVPIYRRLVLVLKLRAHPRLHGPIDTENVYLKIFKDIPKLDVLMLLPGARVRLSRLDRGKIGLPLLSGLALVAWNLLKDMASFLETGLSSPSTLWALGAAGIGYGYKSFYGYLQTRQRYHLTLTRSLYFQNLDSNAGVLTRLLDEAEEQESRLAILAYWCLHCHGGAGGWTAADLDTSVELYLDRYADLTLVCRNNAALTLLKKLRLIEESGGRFRALPLARAIEVLHADWDHPFLRPRVGSTNDARGSR